MSKDYTPEELQKYYEARFDMMASRGWKELLEDVQAMLDATNDISAIQDEKTLHFKRGELSIMRWLLAIEQASRDAFEQQKEQK